MIFETKTLTVSIDAPFNAVADDLANPITHPEWATEFFTGDAVPNDKGGVNANVPMMGGPVKFEIKADAKQGILDLFLAPETGKFGDPLPVRLIRNGDGVDVLWTLTRYPGMPDIAWQLGLDSMNKELVSLKKRHEEN
ncbi:hypothetical protein MNBD_GAMMA21-1433 [hydrothermal vent metagenome]|uniref:SRPBCC family protein n=1 Tax=hydrothermal vent metagenome TaxID=652676 RepID=A0A3B1AAK8_9ZZZZ